MEYKTITRNHKLDEEINGLIKEGYKPIGGMSMVSVDNKIWMSQALVKTVKRKRKAFLKPNELEIAKYSGEEQLNLTGFYNYFESNNWMVGRNKMKDWKAAARNWHKRQQEYNKETATPQPKSEEQQKKDDLAVINKLGYESEEEYSRVEFAKMMEKLK